jgi:hypothetical protein
MRRASVRERKTRKICTIWRKERIDRYTPAKDIKRDREAKQRDSKHM